MAKAASDPFKRIELEHERKLWLEIAGDLERTEGRLRCSLPGTIFV
jgi:hypothetical protein